MYFQKRVRNEENITFRNLKVRISGLFNPIKVSTSFSPVQQCQPQSNIHCIYRGGSFEYPALGHHCKGRNSQPMQSVRIQLKHNISWVRISCYMYAYNISTFYFEATIIIVIMHGVKTIRTFLKGGHSPSELEFMLSLGSVSVWNTPAVLNLYMGYRHTPDASQKRTVPSSCLHIQAGHCKHFFECNRHGMSNLKVHINWPCK